MFAAMLSFHNVVARYAFAMGREGLLPARFGRTNRRERRPRHRLAAPVRHLRRHRAGLRASPTTSHIGDPTAPVLHLFTWMGNVGALGVILLMAAASFAVIAFFVKRGAGRAQARRLVASGLAGIALLSIAVYTVKDFDVLVGSGDGLRPQLAAARRHRRSP